MEAFQSMVTRLFYRCLLQLWIHLYYPEEWIRVNFLMSRDDAIQYPVGKLPFTYKQTTFAEYVHHFYKSKHPEDVIPSTGLGFQVHSYIEEILLFYNTYNSNFACFASLYVLMNLYPLGFLCNFPS